MSVREPQAWQGTREILENTVQCQLAFARFLAHRFLSCPHHPLLEDPSLELHMGLGGELVSQILLAAAAAMLEFHMETFTKPLNHFYNSTDATNPQCFWVNLRHYKPRPGAPVILIDWEETNGEDCSHFLNTGIADILA